jgi:hypothetical protein
MPATPGPGTPGAAVNSTKVVANRSPKVSTELFRLISAMAVTGELPAWVLTRKIEAFPLASVTARPSPGVVVVTLPKGGEGDAEKEPSSDRKKTLNPLTGLPEVSIRAATTKMEVMPSAGAEDGVALTSKVKVPI